jgi:hypothetical protein
MADAKGHRDFLLEGTESRFSDVLSESVPGVAESVVEGDNALAVDGDAVHSPLQLSIRLDKY